MIFFLTVWSMRKLRLKYGRQANRPLCCCPNPPCGRASICSCLMAMHMVPDQREHAPDEIADGCGQHDEADRTERLERLNHPNWPNEMQPKNKIHYWLRDAACDQHHPAQMHRAQNAAER